MVQLGRVLLFSFCVPAIMGIRFFNLHIDKEETEMDSNIGTVTFKLTKNKNGDSVINGNLVVKEDVNDFVVYSTAYGLEKNGQYESFYVNTTVDACKFAKRVKKEPMVKMILAEISKSSNLPFQCPVKKGEYYLKNFAIPSDLLPPFLPEKSFKSEAMINRIVEGKEVFLLHTIWYTRLEKIGIKLI